MTHSLYQCSESPIRHPFFSLRHGTPPQANSLIDSIPKDLNRPWEDPMPDAGERHFAQELRSVNLGASYEMSEWKQVRCSGLNE